MKRAPADASIKRARLEEIKSNCQGNALVRSFSSSISFTKAHPSLVPIVISCLALLLGCINFYWTFLKDSKALHLIYVGGQVANGMQPEFALVNGGKKDVLLTNLTCSFGALMQKGSSFTPAQTNEFREADSYLLPSGKGFHVRTMFTEKFTSSFAKSGEPKLVQNQRLYMHDMYVDISWVEMDGTLHTRSVKLIRYGFGEAGDIRSMSPMRRAIDLYETGDDP